MKSINCILILLLFCSFFSCRRTEQAQQYKQSDFFFQIQESDMGITCSKRSGAEFYVMFSKESAQLSDSIDYLKYETGDDGGATLIFDPHNINNVYIVEAQQLKEVHSVHYNLQVLKSSDCAFQFFETSTSLEPKYPYIVVKIFTCTFSIDVIKHEVVNKTIKKGDIYGGW